LGERHRGELNKFILVALNNTNELKIFRHIKVKETEHIKKYISYKNKNGLRMQN
jgi:hypothetical protein